jgi:predicted transposase/invertase (TIGR01784 family)
MFRFLSPKSDFVFHKLFGQEKNKDVLISFLNAVFDGVHDTIEEVIEILPPILYPEVKVMRQSIVDILCRDSKGRRFVIEMQCARDQDFIKRSIAYASAVYLSQRTEKEDTGYDYMGPVIFLGVLDFTLFPKDESHVSHHMITNIATGKRTLDILSFSFVELPKFKKTLDELETVMDRWSYFFKNAPGLDPDEVDQMKEKMPVMNKAFDTLSRASYTEAELLTEMRFRMKADEINSRIRTERLDAKISVALSMFAEGLSMDVVTKCIGMTAEEIEKAIKEKEEAEKTGG